MINKGYISEQLFVAECLKNGINISIPIIKDCPYDFIVDGIKLKKVQVKSCLAGKNHGKQIRYRVDIAKGASNNKRPYSLKDFDVLAIHLISCDDWYLIPILHILGKKWLSISPLNVKDKYNVYRGGWKNL